MDWRIDVATLIVLAGILIATWYQRATLLQVKRQSDAAVETLTAMNAQTVQMQAQTKEMRDALRDESRPVLFSTFVDADPPQLLIGNQGRNPARNLRIEFSHPVTDIEGREWSSLESPILPGGYALVLELREPAVHLLASKIGKSRERADAAEPIDFILEINVHFEDAISHLRYDEKLAVEDLSGGRPLSMRALPR